MATAGDIIKQARKNFVTAKGQTPFSQVLANTIPKKASAESPAMAKGITGSGSLPSLVKSPSPSGVASTPLSQSALFDPLGPYRKYATTQSYDPISLAKFNRAGVANPYNIPGGIGPVLPPAPINAKPESDIPSWWDEFIRKVNKPVDLTGLNSGVTTIPVSPPVTLNLPSGSDNPINQGLSDIKWIAIAAAVLLITWKS